MAIRPTMINLIATLRGMTNAGTADYTIRLTNYWSDTQLQAALDRYATPIRDEELSTFPVLNTSGAMSYYDYQSGGRFYESTSGGTARFIIKDTSGAVQASSGWSADYEKGLITFNADTSGATYYLSGYSYDIYAAAADVWYQKAAHASEMVDFSTDNHNIKRSHIATLALKMAQRYENMANAPISGKASPELVRGDINANSTIGF